MSASPFPLVLVDDATVTLVHIVYLIERLVFWYNRKEEEEYGLKIIVFVTNFFFFFFKF
jgi:hypothetical protein